MRNLFSLSRSSLVDISMLVIEFFSGLFIMEHFNNNDDFVMMFFSGALAVAIVLYIMALFVGSSAIYQSGSFTKESLKNFFAGTLVNGVLLMSFLSVALTTNTGLWLMITLLIGGSGLWIWMHYSIAKKAAQNSEDNPDAKSIVSFPALILAFPLVQMLLSFNNFMLSLIDRSGGLVVNIFQTLLLTIVLYVITFIPRKFFKAMAGLRMDEDKFIILLFLSIAFRVFIQV